MLTSLIKKKLQENLLPKYTHDHIIYIYIHIYNGKTYKWSNKTSINKLDNFFFNLREEFVEKQIYKVFL